MIVAEQTMAFSEGWTESDTGLGNTSVTPSAASVANKDNIPLRNYMQAILALVVFFGNILILVAIRRSRAMKKVTYLFLGHLAVADVLFGMGGSIRFYLTVADQLSKYSCLLNMCFIITSGGSSFTGTLFLSLDSYVSVKYFMSSKRVLTSRMALGMIAVCWLFWVSLALLSVVLASYNPIDSAVCSLGGDYYERWYLFLISSIYFCNLLLVIYYQFGTLVIIRRHFTQLTPQVQVGVDNIQTFAQKANKRRRLRKLSNLYKLVGMVVGVFFICWTPYMIVLSAKATCTGDCSKLEDISKGLGSMLIFSSLMNVFIYAAKSPEFREGFRKALWPRCNRVGVRN